MSSLSYLEQAWRRAPLTSFCATHFLLGLDNEFIYREQVTQGFDIVSNSNHAYHTRADKTTALWCLISAGYSTHITRWDGSNVPIPRLSSHK